jgi:hypothetical protein
LFEFVYLYDGICIYLNEEIVNYNSMIISKWQRYDFQRAKIFGSNEIFSSSSPLIVFDVADNLYRTEKAVLDIYEPTGTIGKGYVIRT